MAGLYRRTLNHGFMSDEHGWITQGLSDIKRALSFILEKLKKHVLTDLHTVTAANKPRDYQHVTTVLGGLAED